jgi:hypothetical protein
MKVMTPAIALAAFAFAAAIQPAAAQRYQGRWCAVFNIGFGSVQEQCDFPNFATCRREAAVWGASAFCRQNNWYAPYWGVPAPEPRARARRHHRGHR